MHQFLPGALSWEPAAELGTALNSLAIFSNLIMAASQGKASELAPGLGSPGQRKGEGSCPLLSFKGTRTRLQVKYMAYGQAKILCLLRVEGSPGDIRCGPETSELEGHSKGLRKWSHSLSDSASLSWMLPDVCPISTPNSLLTHQSHI